MIYKKNYYVKIISVYIILLYGLGVFASSDISKMKEKAFYQSINLVIILLSSLYFFRKPLVSFIRERKARFLEKSRKSQELVAVAQRKVLDVQAKIVDLERTWSVFLLRVEQDLRSQFGQRVVEKEEIFHRETQMLLDSRRAEVNRKKQEAQRVWLTQLREDFFGEFKNVITQDDFRKKYEEAEKAKWLSIQFRKSFK